MKKCSTCCIEKPLTEFYTDKTKKDGYSYSCKECKREKMRERSKVPELAQKARERSKIWYLANKEHVEKCRKEKYIPIESSLNKTLLLRGMTRYEYDLLLYAQNGKCAICGSNKGSKSGQRLVVDHCHETNMVRGLLCHSCNRGLGMFRDSATIVLSALNYLKETQDV